ncbi:MAG: DUF748 domain-containing protein [Dysgonamonadaceae bacterium]
MNSKALKIIACIVAFLIVIIVAFALCISPLAKNYIEKNSKKLVGRKVLMKDLKINIFEGSLRIDSIRMYEKDDKRVFTSIDSFFVDISLLKLISKDVVVNKLTVVRPYAVVEQKGDHFNFDDLIKLAKDTTGHSSSKSSFPKSVVIKKINISDGIFVYKDLLLKNTIRMNNLGVAIPKLAFNLGKTDAGIHLKINNDATLACQLSMNTVSNKYKLKLKLEHLPIDIIKPYMKEYYNIDKLEGVLNSNLEINGNALHLMEYTVKGDVGMKGFNLTNSKQEPIVSAQNISMKIKKIDVTSSEYLFDYIYGNGAVLDFILHPQMNNFTNLFKPVSSKASDTPAVIFKVQDLFFKNSAVTYTDNTLRSKFKLPLTNVDFHVKNYDLNGTNEYNITASFPKGGKGSLLWKANLNNLKTQQINMDFKNINLQSFSPYCLEYTAYDITSGNMNFESKNDLRNNYITSSNKIDVYKMNVGKKHKEMKVEYNIPLKLGLYILKDKDDKIKFDIPVKGNINDPKFSYKKIVLKTLMNLMVKIAVSPIRFLSGLMGLGGNSEMTSLQVEALQSELTAEQFSKLENLVKMYEKKPDFNLSLIQYADIADIHDDFLMFLAKKAYAESKFPANDGKVQLRYEDVESIRNNDEDFRSFIENHIARTVDSLSRKNMTFPEKVSKLYATDSVQPMLLRQLNRKNMLIKEYLVNTGHIPALKLKVLTAPADSLKNYKGKSQFKIDMALPE